MMEWGHQAPRRRREDEWDNREAVADLLRECDRYREALERIAREGADRNQWWAVSAAWGVCHFHVDAWVCDSCGDEFWADSDDDRYDWPGRSEQDDE